jgi:uncharacterized protein YgbK (DUF1537 family)
VVDCRSEADLAAIATAGLTAPGDVLFVGAAGLADAIARRAYGEEARVFRPPLGKGPLLVVVGSLAAASRDQVERLHAAMPGLAELVALPQSGDAGTDSLDPDADVVLLRSCEDARGANPLEVAACLAERAEALIAERAPRALVLSGGDTARAVLDRLGVTALDVMGETAPGVVASRCRLRGRTATIVTKAGGFGRADLFVELARRL